MKILEPTITCLVLSHMKPTLGDELRSLEKQTRRQDLQIVVIDSGAWIDKEGSIATALHQAYTNTTHSNFEWYFTGEPSNARDLYCPVSHWTNVAFKEGLVRGKYVCMGYDDDIHYPTFMEKMAGYLDTHPEAMAVRCTQNRCQVAPDGTRTQTPPLVADRFIEGQNFDCVVDGMQVMFRKELLDKLEYPYMDESPDWNSCSHSDGLFFNRLGTTFDTMHFIQEALCEHQATQYSTFTPTT